MKKLRDLIEPSLFEEIRITRMQSNLIWLQRKVLLFYAEDRFINTLDLTHDYGNELRK